MWLNSRWAKSFIQQSKSMMSSKSIICWHPNQRAGWVLWRGLICWQPWDSQVESIGLAWLSIDSLDGKRATKGVLGPKDISPNTRSLSVFFTERRWACGKGASGGKAFLTSFPFLTHIPPHSFFSLPATLSCIFCWKGKLRDARRISNYLAISLHWEDTSERTHVTLLGDTNLWAY